MDGNNKNISPVDPLPPLYLSVALMYCPGVHANSVHAICAGNVNDRLNRGLESRAWLVVCLALLRGTFRGTFVAVPMAIDLCSTLTLWNIACLLGFIANSNCSHLFTALFP
jgi:hypothetical protein